MATQLKQIAKRHLTSPSLWVGVLLALLACTFVPWRQEFDWRVGETLVPMRALRYRPWWDRPWNASLDFGLLFLELALITGGVLFVRRYERQRVQRARPVTVGTLDVYSAADWNAEVKDKQAGAPPRACPHCRRSGFYGPREESGGRRYRMCSFCGFRQDVGSAPQHLRPCVHGCGRAPLVAGAPAITWVKAGQVSFQCEYCGEVADAAASLVMSPETDVQHPWRQVPQGLSQQGYLRYWVSSGAPGRVYL